MHHEALDVLPRLLDAFRVRRLVLYGHSDGASIALISSGSGAVSPAALVLQAPHVFVEDLTVTNIAALRTPYKSGDLRQRLLKHHGSNTDPLFEAWTRVWLNKEFRRWNIEDTLPAIACPTLIIQGRDDEYGTLRQVEAVAAGVAGRAETLLLDECGHSPHIDRASEVITAAAGFLEKAGV
jgi:pimeloyl-ACP methyl ester carboxylesterase